MTVENRVGRFCEALFVPPFSVGEVDGIHATARRVMAATDARLVFCCDMRRIQIFPPAIADAVMAMMVSENLSVERNGLLLGRGSIFDLQMERIIRDARNPGRRAFHSTESLLAWLSDVLDDAERQRLGAFLAEGDALGDGNTAAAVVRSRRRP